VSLPNDKQNPSLGSENLRYYYDLMISQDLLELEVREGDFHLRLSRRPAAAGGETSASSLPVEVPVATLPEAVPSLEQNQCHAVASPLAGIFYRSGSPASPPFVKEGDKVVFGDVLCIVEAMKVMNEIRADRPCVIGKILVENGKPVFAGQNLFRVDPIS
jgi:acetyl-CoA carboxylase biotin carboxyl carrier protein